MSIEKNLDFLTTDLIDDINFINQANMAEIKSIDNRLRQRIGDEIQSQETADSLIQEISTQLGQLAVKVELVEKIIHSLKPEQKLVSDTYPVSAGITDKQQVAHNLFTADVLAENNNILSMETSSNGVSYCWSGADPEIRFQFSLDRARKLEMQIWIFALIKPEYSKQLMVFIDGEHIKHQFRLKGSLFFASCLLPVSDKKGQTEVKIVLPGTHSPADLSGSKDGRQLGIAISEISFVPPASGFVRLLRRLRLSK
jgi:hypothetical protein